MASQGEERLLEEDEQINPVNPFPPRGSPLTSKITKGTVLAGLGKERLNYLSDFVFQRYRDFVWTKFIQ